MNFIIDILELWAVFAILAISLNFLLGNLGISFLGHIAFFAVGAYSSAIFSYHSELSVAAGMIVGIIVSTSLAYFLGTLTFRLSGHFLLITSLGVCEIVKSIANNSEVTGSAAGIVVQEKFLSSNIFWVKCQVPIIIFSVLILEVLFFRYLSKIPKGRLFNGVKENSVLLVVMGNNTTKLKLEALIISSVWASLAGSLFALYTGYIDPTSFTVEISLLLYIAILIGGIATIKGSLFAAFLLIVVPVLIRFIPMPVNIISPLQQIAFAVFVIMVLKYKPNGIWGKPKVI